MPKFGGIFSVATTRQQLCDPSALGLIDEDMAVFGQRMQLLLDSRAVFNPDAFRDLQAGILERFVESGCREQRDRADIWRPLIDDLLRYHRSLCVRYHHAKGRCTPGWPDLQLKAGYSRLINIVGLLFLLAESTVQTESIIPWVVQHLSFTPLDRIAQLYDAYRDGTISSVLSHYGGFLAALNDESFRVLLNNTEKGFQPDCEGSQLAKLHTAACALKSELLRFLLVRVQHGDWPQSFLEHLLL